ncbi:MAG: NAD(P)/FAD-dependent oxidoreductase [Bacteroidales bacterium]|nr:NAD(P)/FAD-dependent oxidoreductase [Bacteroidales bacterium]
MENTSQKKTAVIAGAGPAGLTAALELLRHTNIHPVILEKDEVVGGISRTVRYHGNRMDIGGHRFFSKSPEVLRWWDGLMPLQRPEGPDPEKEDRVMLRRPRISRIYFLRKFFDYPITMKKETFSGLGLRRVLHAGFGYLWSCIHRLPETSLENFYINRFGRPLYRMFFEAYTEKVWGIHPSKLGADWGSQRVKGLSVSAVLRDMLSKALGRKDRDGAHVETSLIEEFIYPKYGPGQLWETAAEEIMSLGGEILMESEIVKVKVERGEVKSVSAKDKDGNLTEIHCDYFLSSMPVKDLITCIEGTEIPVEVREVAAKLPYRDFITAGLCVNKLKIGRIQDTWIYIQERDVKLGRLQIFNNWSPYLVKDCEETLWLGLEYFCSEGDELWQMSDDDFIHLAEKELIQIGLIDEGCVLDACRVKVKKAYPAYFGSYYSLNTVKTFLDTIPNLFCIGRNGQHRYNNMDHSMLTAMECVRIIQSGNLTDKDAMWNVNTEEEYHETKKS